MVYGAGTAGTGMADQISAAMQREGLSGEEARKRVWLIDRNGLVTDDMPNLPNYQQAYARPAAEVASWAREGRSGDNGHEHAASAGHAGAGHQGGNPAAGKIGLLEVVKRVKPTILIGTSTDHGAFTEDVVKALAAGVERPILLPLSNPTEKIEVMPSEAIPWSEGRALMATGIPLPPVDNLRASSATVAVAVAKQAVADGVATKPADNWVQVVQDAMWQPVYRS